MTTKKTYNFIEAVNSGKRFRAKSMVCSWYEVDRTRIFQMSHGVIGCIEADILHLVNSQFTLEEKSITITESEFDKAVKRARIGEGCIGITESDIKKELGF